MFWTAEEEHDSDLALSSCKVDLLPSPCQNGTCGHAVLHYTAVLDFAADGNKVSGIVADPIESSNFLWSGYVPDVIQVLQLTFMLAFLRFGEETIFVLYVRVWVQLALH